MLKTRLDSKMQIRGKCSSNSLFTAISKFKRQKHSSVLTQGGETNQEQGAEAEQANKFTEAERGCRNRS